MVYFYNLTVPVNYKTMTSPGGWSREDDDLRITKHVVSHTQYLPTVNRKFEPVI